MKTAKHQSIEMVGLPSNAKMLICQPYHFMNLPISIWSRHPPMPLHCHSSFAHEGSTQVKRNVIKARAGNLLGTDDAHAGLLKGTKEIRHGHTSITQNLNLATISIFNSLSQNGMHAPLAGVRRCNKHNFHPGYSLYG